MPNLKGKKNQNIYLRKQQWKLMLFIVAVTIGIASLWYTNALIQKLSKEERKNVELWAEAIRQLSNTDLNQDLNFVTNVIINNKTIPGIVVDESGDILHVKNLDTLKMQDEKWLRHELEKMKEQHEPIVIALFGGGKQFIYYRDSILLTQLFYYPYIQLAVIFLFILVSYFAFSSSRKAEQNQVWVGMSKETAHQLGTPISSLLAWIELLKLQDEASPVLKEVKKDVERLETITERFSKIGSAPVLLNQNIAAVLNHAVQYLKTRSPEKIHFQLMFSEDDNILIPLNISLFEWVIENLCKNAMDAMDGVGTITISLIDNNQVVYLDISDTGKGIPKSKFKTVFQPGYTTKKRGWGLGLSLAKRIIEEYHEGKIFVKSSENSQGTTFRIALKK
jgi:signal transduction histidine kinase